MTAYTDALEKFNRECHSDALREMQILPFAEHVQADPVSVIRSIDRADFIWSACIFIALGFVAGALFAIGGTQ